MPITKPNGTLRPNIYKTRNPHTGDVLVYERFGCGPPSPVCAKRTDGAWEARGTPGHYPLMTDEVSALLDALPFTEVITEKNR